MKNITNIPTSQDRQAAEVAELRRQVARWKAAIEGLTPSGSEFVDDPERCAAHIRARTNWPRQIIEARRKVQRLRTALVTILGQASAFKQLNPFAADSVSEIQAVQETGALIEKTASDAIAEAARPAPIEAAEGKADD